MSDKNRALRRFVNDYNDSRLPHVSATVVGKRLIPFVDLLSLRKDILIMWYYVFDIYNNRNPYVMGPFREYEDAASGCRSHEKVVEHNQPYRLAELNAQYPR